MGTETFNCQNPVTTTTLRSTAPLSLPFITDAPYSFKYIQVMSRHKRIVPGQQEGPAQAPRPIPEQNHRLRMLLWILTATTIALIAQQLMRWKIMGSNKVTDLLYAREAPPSAGKAGVDMNSVAGHASVSAPAIDLVKTETDDTGPVQTGVSQEEQYLPVQLDDDGELDMGTMERMLDILYKRPDEMEGYEAMEAEPGSYRFRKETRENNNA